MKLIPFPKLLDIQQQQEVYKEITNENKVQSFVSYNQPIVNRSNLKQQSLMRNPNENELPTEHTNSYHFPKRNITNKLRNQQTVTSKKMPPNVPEEITNGVVFLPQVNK